MRLLEMQKETVANKPTPKKAPEKEQSSGGVSRARTRISARPMEVLRSGVRSQFI
eukprot:SAG25_NODE_8988_length_393_cov_1.006803_1_plen_54_part_01